MASACASHLSPAMASLRSPLLPRALSSRPMSLLPSRRSTKCVSHQSASFSACTFTWDDFLQASRPQYSDDDDSSDLAGFVKKIRLCNRGSEMQSDFLPFVVEDQIVGYVHHGHVGLHPLLETPEDRTETMARVVKCLGQELIPALSSEIFIWRFENILS